MINIFEIEPRPVLNSKNEDKKLNNSNPLKLFKKLLSNKASNKDAGSQEYVDVVYDNLLNIKMTALEYCKKLWQLVHNKVTIYSPSSTTLPIFKHKLTILEPPSTDISPLWHHSTQSCQCFQKNHKLH